MQREDMAKLLTIMAATYPSLKAEDPEQMVSAWMAIAGDLSYHDMAGALKKYARTDTTGFAPSIGALMSLIETPEDDNALVAWSRVQKAVKNSGYNSEREFLLLPEDIQRAVGSPGQLKAWALMDSKSFETVEQSHFIRVYETEKLRARNRRMTAPGMQIETTAEPVARIEGEVTHCPKPKGCVPMPEGFMDRLRDALGDKATKSRREDMYRDEVKRIMEGRKDNAECQA